MFIAAIVHPWMLPTQYYAIYDACLGDSNVLPSLVSKKIAFRSGECSEEEFIENGGFFIHAL